MKISTKGRYGLRLMIDIATHEARGPVTLKEVAARQEISEKYLEQIIIKLSKAGLVHGTRGAHGGYVLTRTPAKITAGDILRVVEGLSPVACVDCEAGVKSPCERAESCLTIALWRDMKEALEKVANCYSLEKMIHLYHEKTPE